MAKPITMALLQNKIGSSPYNEVKKLNLWGIDCEDVSPLSIFPNLQILQLSRNQIGTLKHISKLKQLKELYLGQNKIKDIKELEYLKELYNLRVLNLIENPVVEHPEYKKVALKHCLALQILDDSKIMEQDREFLQEQELSIQEQSQNLDDNSDQVVEYENEKQIKNKNEKEKSKKKKLKIQHKFCQSSDQSTNGSKNKFDTYSQKLSNTVNDVKIYPITSETTQQFQKKKQKFPLNDKGEQNKKKKSHPQPTFIQLDSDYSLCQSIKSHRSTLKKLKKLSDKSDQNSQLIQSKLEINLDKQEEHKNSEESWRQMNINQIEDIEEIKVQKRNEQLNEYLVSVIQNLIQFIDKRALQCLYKILCEQVK
ncbi:unnamed protein product [Paramecium sonneborni]|uniref:Leucine rich repeat protein n=1 Tax=Paramecium sonneborni TaxID=65129 RepID=A0A8S1NYQ9_9CILI|nr:unnamed protein product [Paramecium sonneborni]